MARKERAALAYLRALEEQAERTNPIAPSTGLSRRGGKSKIPSLKVAEKRMKPSLHNAMEDEMALMPSGEYDGAGKHSLMDHLAAPMKGFGDYLHAFEGGEAPAKMILSGATRKGGLRTGKYEGEGATPSMGLSQFRGGMAMGQVVGSGKMEGGAPRLMMCDDYEPAAAAAAEPAAAAAAAPEGKKKRAPAGPDDGRRLRAAVVKQVMAERGLSMIDASKYVKEHGLYPGKRTIPTLPAGARQALARRPAPAEAAPPAPKAKAKAKAKKAAAEDKAGFWDAVRKRAAMGDPEAAAAAARAGLL